MRGIGYAKRFIISSGPWSRVIKKKKEEKEKKKEKKRGKKKKRRRGKRRRKKERQKNATAATFKLSKTHNVCRPGGSSETDTRSGFGGVFHVRRRCFDRRFSLPRAQRALKYRKLRHLPLRCSWLKSECRVEMAILSRQNDTVVFSPGLAWESAE